MISLQQPTEPYSLEILDGIVFTVKPLDTFTMTKVNLAAEKQYNDFEKGLSDLKQSGFAKEESIDLHDPEIKKAVYTKFLIEELADQQIIAWQGVDGDINAKDAKRMVVRLYPIGDIFFNKYRASHLEMLQAKKDCGTGVNGISAAVPNTADHAEKMATPVPKEKQ